MLATGPVQDQWREWFGVNAWFPRVESTWGAIVTFTLVLYPYVYLLARAALRDQAAGYYHAARVLGASPTDAARRVVLPLVRPAIAAGAAIVMMETLTDYATVQYFGVDTVTVGVFRIWRGTYDRNAASEIATLVLGFALLVIAVERIARRRARFGEAAGAGGGLTARQLRGSKALAAVIVCAAPVLLAFVLPVVRLVTWAIAEQTGARGTPMVSAFPEYLSHSLQLVAVTVAVVLVIAVLVVNARRFGRIRFSGLAARTAVVGYAIPGPVVAMGVLLFVIAVDDGLEAIGGNLPGAAAAGSVLVLCYAYAVRFRARSRRRRCRRRAGARRTDRVGGQRSAPRGGARWQGCMCPSPRRRSPPRRSLSPSTLSRSFRSLLLLRPFGFDTLPVWVYSLAAESRYQQAALPALAIVAVAVLPVLFLVAPARRSPHEGPSRRIVKCARRCRRHEAVRIDGSGRRGRTSRSPTARSSHSWDRAVAASRRCCASWPVSTRPTPARSRCRARWSTTVTVWSSPNIGVSGSSSRSTRCSRI